MTVEQDFPREPGRRVPGRLMLEEFAQQERLPPQTIGARIVGKQIP
jgi:hypothetical protein